MLGTSLIIVKTCSKFWPSVETSNSTLGGITIHEPTSCRNPAPSLDTLWTWPKSTIATKSFPWNPCHGPPLKLLVPLIPSINARSPPPGYWLLYSVCNVRLQLCGNLRKRATAIWLIRPLVSIARALTVAVSPRKNGLENNVELASGSVPSVV